MNKISIKIKNYKAINNVEMSLDNRTNNRLIAIIGDNNAGKSSILGAIEKLSMPGNIKEEEKTKILDTKGKVSPIKDMPEIIGEFLFEDQKDFFPIKTHVTDNKFIPPTKFNEEWLTKRKKLIKDKTDELLALDIKQWSAFLTKDGQTFTDDSRFHAFKTAIEKGNNADAIRLTKEIKKLYSYVDVEKKINVIRIDNSNIFKYNILDLNVLYSDKTNNQSQKHIEQFHVIQTWEKILKVNFEDFIEEYNRGNINDKQIDKEDFENKANLLLDNMSNDFFGKDMKEKLKLTIDVGSMKFNITWEPIKKVTTNIVWDNQLTGSGDGYKRLWSIIFRIHSIHSSKPAIIILDEPEKNLNPIQQNALMKYLKKMSSAGDRNNQIFIYATHSPFMLDLDLYQNILVCERDKTTNASFLRTIYEPEDSGVPNLLLDKSVAIRWVESVKFLPKPTRAIFVEGITEYNVISNIVENAGMKDNVQIFPVFGEEYKKTIPYHYPYLISFMQDEDILVIEDGDEVGKEIVGWIKEKTNIPEENIKVWTDFDLTGENLEEAIMEPWLKENKKSYDINRKKINTLTFMKENKSIDRYKKIVDFIKK